MLVYVFFFKNLFVLSGYLSSFLKKSTNKKNLTKKLGALWRSWGPVSLFPCCKEKMAAIAHPIFFQGNDITCAHLWSFLAPIKNTYTNKLILKLAGVVNFQINHCIN